MQKMTLTPCARGSNFAVWKSHERKIAKLPGCGHKNQRYYGKAELQDGERELR